MKISVAASNGQLVQSGDAIPKSLQQYILPSAQAIAVSDGFGYVLFQHITGNGFQIWHNQYKIKEKCVCFTTSDEPVLELHIVYKNSILFNMETFGTAVMREGRFNFTHIPIIRNASTFKPGDYRSFDVHYSKEFLQRFISYLPALENFLSAVEKKKAALFSKVSPPLTPIMRAAINDILNWDHRDGLTEAYLETKVFELLLHAIKGYSKANSDPFKLATKDIDALYEAKTLLQTDTSYSYSLSSLAKQLGTNEFLLKKGFKWLHGTSVFGYMQEQRMEKARSLLLDTDKQVVEIAFELGYQDLSSFSRAFHNHFGYAPIVLRKNRNIRH